MAFVVRDLQPKDAREIASWQYEGDDSLYDPGESALGFTSQERQYYALSGEGWELAGYCCYGGAATVPEGSYESGSKILDVGLGLRPELVGGGHGKEALVAALEHGRETYAPAVFRATVASFNDRAAATCRRLGFQATTTFVRDRDGLEFVIWERDAEPPFTES